ncbi:unnamed protein product [Brassica oleracea var. botrytis]|uniref:Uncharacterized protein n=2 Tax=Brassica TaxID=3705 RepID=A0A3P6CT40_BRAOL|nr:unnamed protein product [Brassica napus]VDD13565.1 unnamed protein product [Brassica oleracea]
MVMQSGFDGSGEEKTPIIMRIGRDQRGEFIDHK